MFSNKDLKKLLIPLMLEQLLMSLMGLTDTLMVSNIGSAALSAVSLVDSINTLILFLFSALAAGGTIVCAQYLGARDERAANLASRQLMLSMLVLSLICTLLCFLFRESLLHLIYGQVEEEVMSNSMSYFTITLLSYPFIALNNACSALYRATGNSKLPMLVALGANVVHIAGNAVLMFGFELGVSGAAISTLISRMLGALMMMWFLHKPHQVITLDHILAIRPDMNLIKMILRVGIPTGIENALFQVGKLLVQSTVSTLGTLSISVQALIYTLEFLTSVPSLAVGLGLVTVVGQCMGAGRSEEARLYVKKLTKFAGILLLSSSTLILLLTKPAAWLAGMGSEASNMAFWLMLLIFIVKILIWPMAFIPAYGLRAAGDVRYTMLVSAISMWVLRVGLCYVLCRHAGLGLLGVWIAMFADWACRAIFFTRRYQSGKWLQKKVLHEG